MKLNIVDGGRSKLGFGGNLGVTDPEMHNNNQNQNTRNPVKEKNLQAAQYYLTVRLRRWEFCGARTIERHMSPWMTDGRACAL